MKIYFIVNPVAGSGRSAERFAEIRRLLDERGVDYEALYTEKAGQAPELTRRALEMGAEYIAAVGGDGTMQEVASVLVNSGVKLAMLPFGTGNDFASSLNIPKESDKLTELVLRGEAKPVDGAMANGMFFINVSGFGFDTQVVIYTEKFKKRFTGMVAYMLGILETLLHLDPVRVRLTSPDMDGEEEDVLFVAACNGDRFAGGMRLAPHAKQDDGLLDVCVLRRMNIFQFMLLLPRFIKGKHLDSRFVRYFKTPWLECEAERDTILNIDGELGSGTPVRFKALPKALTVVY